MAEEMDVCSWCAITRIMVGLKIDFGNLGSPAAAAPILRVVTSTDSLAADYLTITQACGLLDRSERGKLALSGPDARSFLQGQVTNDVEALRPGHGCYAAFLTPKGKMLGDLRILDTAAELFLDT